MKTAHDIIRKIGKPRVKAGLGVADRTINQYTHDGKLPASWYDFCETETGQKLDRSLFTFKRDKASGDSK